MLLRTSAAWLVVLGLGVVQSLAGQETASYLRLRTRTIDTSSASGRSLGDAKFNAATSGGSFTNQRVHLIGRIQDGAALDQPALTLRGINVLGYVPDNGVVFSADPATDLTSLGLAWIGSLQAGDRMSTEVSAADPSSPGYFVVEFFTDVDMADARGVVLGEYIAIQENPYLLPNQLLVFGSPDQMSTLAGYDQVEFIFLASDELIQGIPQSPCYGPQTVYGALPMMAAALSGGWSSNSPDGTVDLTYSLGPLTSLIPASDIVAAFQSIQQQWTSYVKVNFTQTSDRSASRNVDLWFASGDHGDPLPFDGPGGVLAHTFYPSPPNPEPIAGDMHLDNAETWTNGGTGTDFSAVALHEMGHALGLGHSTSPLDVMYPYYRRNMTLSQGDILAIQQLYPARQGSGTTPPPAATPLSLTIQPVASPVSAGFVAVSGTVAGGQGTITITWSTSRGATGIAPLSAGNWSIAAVPLAEGMNIVSVTAQDGNGATASQSASVQRVAATTPPLALTVQPVAAQMTSATVNLTGSVTGGQGAPQITWSTDRGGVGTGQVSGTTWNAAGIPLASGHNLITIGAVDGTGVAAATPQTVSVERIAGTTPIAPQLAITAPSGAGLTTSALTSDVTGTATHPVGIRTISFHVTPAGSSGVAQGTTSWDTGSLGLTTGLNTVTINALALDGGTASASVQITVSSGGGGGGGGGTTTDTTKPSLTITSPAATSLVTSASTLTITGTASDNVGVTSVRWESATASGPATGTSNWSTGPIPLFIGMNNLVVRAYDAAGNSGWRTISVTRQ